MKHLTLEQRYHISALVKAHHSQGRIAELVGCDKSTISRELGRNSDKRDSSYWPDLAQRKAAARHRAKPKKRRFTASVQAYVREKIESDYSPEQIAGNAARKGIGCVSHERIYQFVWADKKQGGGLYRHMRTKGKRYATGAVCKAKGAKSRAAWTSTSARRSSSRSSGWVIWRWTWSSAGARAACC